MPVTLSFNMQRNTLCANQKRGQKLTVCYWKPSVLLLDFEFVGQTRGVWVLRVVHLIRIVRRLYTLYFVRIFWRGCRHNCIWLLAGLG